MFSGIWIPLVTPFRSGEVDIESLQALTEHYARSGIAGFVALGTTGEAALLSDIERVTVLQAISDVVDGRLPILVGIGGFNTHEFISEIRRFEHWDVAGFLVSAPAYVCPDQAGITAHFDRITRETERSIVLYDVPHRTGVSIEPDTVRRLAEHDNIVAIKACVSRQFAALRELPINLLCGTDADFLDCLAAGGHGGILASAHVCPDLFVEMDSLMQAGNVDTARGIFERLSPVLRLLFAAPNPSAIKAMLSIEGRLADEVRLPLMPASATLVEQLAQSRTVLDELRAEIALAMQ
ncbi:4-hydroxy-tetrahydrodipicolinate synthase [Paraburkholderia sp. C35]|uniref:4-hydroxy-tetrahydrodipicolinate synthase n=1 Tax=Paraburkholderia sp. C35 TaxID=2126993 RepID=UPI000D69704D|nr:4-hydroxy-tetrahydrodipicolinate synthase [Paraburkholderia sp. C35]